jgi:hypothetical protein
MSKTYSERKKELEWENLNKLSLEFLKSPLVVDTDYEPENEGDPLAYRTEDYAFMFVPQMDDPVMSERTLLWKHPLPGRYRYSVEIGVSSGGSYWEPPDYDQVEIAREDSLGKAIGAAAHWILDQAINGFSEGWYWEMEGIMEKEFPVIYEDFK